MPFHEELHDLRQRRIEVEVGIVHALRVLREPDLELVGNRRGRMTDEAENLRGVEREVTVDEGRMVGFHHHAARAGEAWEAVGRNAAQEAFRVAEG